MVLDDVLVREGREDTHFIFNLRTDTRRLKLKPPAAASASRLLL